MKIQNYKKDGIYITFNNGIEISTTFGKYSLSDKGDSTVEMMFMKGDGHEDFINDICDKHGRDNPIGNLLIEDWIDIITKCKNLT